nr:hypothetical protein [Tanacetum cinerariifolium]
PGCRFVVGLSGGGGSGVRVVERWREVGKKGLQEDDKVKEYQKESSSSSSMPDGIGSSGVNAAKAQTWKFPVCYDDDDDEESSNSLEDNIISELPPYSAVTHTEPIDSLSMGDEHLGTILATESDEFIKSCVENLVPNPNVPEKIYSNPLFDEEIIPMKIDQHSFNAESDLIESTPNHDSSIIISSKIDSL